VYQGTKYRLRDGISLFLEKVYAELLNPRIKGRQVHPLWISLGPTRLCHYEKQTSSMFLWRNGWQFPAPFPFSSPLFHFAKIPDGGGAGEFGIASSRMD